MIQVIIWTILFSISSALSIVLLGQRDLLGKNIFSPKGFLELILNYKFILSMLFALISRVSFMMTNQSLYKIPRLSNSSTTITLLITTTSILLTILANYIFLKERFSLTQVVGGIIILVGVFTILK